MALADRAKELLASRGDNMNQAAARTGLGYATIHGIINGTNQNPSTETLERFAAGYNVPVSRLLDDSPLAVREGDIGYGGDLSEAERWLDGIISPEMRARWVGTPAFRDNLLGASDIVSRRDWPTERKVAVQALIYRLLEDAGRAGD